MGIPPLLGFFGKFFAFAPAMEAGMTWLVVLALIASVIGAFYYLRLVKIMWGAGLYPHDGTPQQAAQMSFVAALALADTSRRNGIPRDSCSRTYIAFRFRNARTHYDRGASRPGYSCQPL